METQETKQNPWKYLGSFPSVGEKKALFYSSFIFTGRREFYFALQLPSLAFNVSN